MSLTGQEWSELWWPAPAKLNLMLKITGRRDDGYHNLQTVFQLVGLSDWLNFSANKTGLISLSGDDAGAKGSANLIVQAATLLQKKSNSKDGVEIKLKKVLPIGAGLGGGSSDAATTLMVLNELWNVGLSIEELAVIGLSLGADVPLFIHGRSAWAEGIGEKLSPIKLDESWYLIVSPTIHNSTNEIFTHKELTRDSSAITIRDFLEGQRVNDCLPVVKKVNKEFDRIYQQFSRFSKVYLTGTGSSMFATLTDRQSAVQLEGELPDSWNTLIVKGVNESPLHTVLKNLKNQV